MVEAIPRPPPAGKSRRWAIVCVALAILGVLVYLAAFGAAFTVAKEASGIDRSIDLADQLLTRIDFQMAQARCTKAKTEIEGLKAAVNMYLIMTGVLPGMIEDLKKPLKQNAEGIWSGALEDPWGHPYEYERVDRRRFVIRCNGRDGKPGGEGEDADIDTDHLESDK